MEFSRPPLSSKKVRINRLDKAIELRVAALPILCGSGGCSAKAGLTKSGNRDINRKKSFNQRNNGGATVFSKACVELISQ